VLAQYLIMGQFEYVQEGEPLPLAILPIGAVPKSTFPWWRLILDCRYSNQFIDRPPFKVKLFKQNECQNGYVEWEGEQAGCTTSSCGRLCDKSALGFAAEGHVMRAACTPFGMAVSHGTLAILTDAVQSYGFGAGVWPWESS
jgi:hypothetical protein